MKQLDLNKASEFVNKNIIVFHSNKIKTLKNMNLKKLLKTKNPYLFRAKNISIASDLIINILDAYLYASEEKIFGDFLEDLAIFIAGETVNGRKSSATGIDLEFNENNAHYIVSIKSGTSWGNSSQQKKQEENFKLASKVLKQSNHILNVQAILGICYGKTKTSFVRGYRKVVGQNFWYLISKNKNLYTDIIEPLGYKAKEHNQIFNAEKAKVINQFTKQFLKDFCNKNGTINWTKLVEFNSGNLDIN